VTLLDPVPLLPDRELEVRPVQDFEPGTDPSTFGGISLKLRGVTYSMIRNREGVDDASPAALAKVTARAQVKVGVGVDGSTGWRTVAEFGLGRDHDRQEWTTVITARQIREVDPNIQRLLVVEEDHTMVAGPVGDGPTFAPRTVFAEAVDVGPFPEPEVVPVDPGPPPEGGR